MVKPGYRTSEFWFTLVSFLFSGLYLVGLIDDHSHKEDLIHETSRGVEATILILGQLTVLYRYIKGRTDLKKTWWGNASETDKKEANRKNTKITTPKRKRKPTTKPKKTPTNNTK